MQAYVVDASVACKWYFEEELSDKAELLLQDDAYTDWHLTSSTSRLAPSRGNTLESLRSTRQLPRML